jgi:hypothetical protein
MSIGAIGSTSAAPGYQPGAVVNPSAKKAAPAAASPAATVTLTAVPASVSAADRALYLQLLKSAGGNAAVALAQLQARKASEGAN